MVHNAPLTKQEGRPEGGLCFAIHVVLRSSLSHPSESALALEMRLPSLGTPECNCACNGSGPGPYGAAVVAALNDPLTVFMADNFPDVMAPHHDRADRGTAGV